MKKKIKQPKSALVEEDILGSTYWDYDVYVYDIWRLTKNEDDFIKLFSFIVQHEELHKAILDNMHSNMEWAVGSLLPEPQHVRKIKRKSV